MEYKQKYGTGQSNCKHLGFNHASVNHLVTLLLSNLQQFT